MTDSKLKVALVGCGQIADAHLGEIRRILCARAVAVCDQYLDLAKQAAARFGVPGVFTDLGKMLAEVRPDVLHVATPPHTHCPLTLQALAAGLHVYVEKPFTVDVTEAEEVLAAAVAAERLVCVGHDQLYDPAWQECRELYQRGELGEVVHVDAVLGYDLAGPYGRVTASDPDHWVHRLPGKFFHNTIAHALYKITDFLLDEEPRIFATWFGALPGTDCPTELRVFLQGADVTANLLSSSAIEPSQRVTRVYGTRRVVEVDLDGRLLRQARAPTLRGPLVKLELPWRQKREAGRSFRRNLWSFLRSRLHYFTGMHRLLTEFYQSIRTHGEPPIPYAEIRRLTVMMDQIFRSCRANERLSVSEKQDALKNGDWLRPPSLKPEESRG